MAGLANGSVPAGSNGVASERASSPRCPRRLVLLADGEASAVAEVLAEYAEMEVSGKRLHADLQRLALAHLGRCLAAEWLGPRGWTRFLWCQKEKK
jgi:hypothetical protein